jgi:uncharacterized membrane-anchored protein YjiN (DUF445 family)
MQKLIAAVRSLPLDRKVEVLNVVLNGMGLKALSTEKLEAYQLAAQVRGLANQIDVDERNALVEAIADYLKHHSEDDDLKRFLEQAITMAKKRNSKRGLQIISRQIYEQLTIDKEALSSIITCQEVLSFYMKFRCNPHQKLIQTAKALAKLG